MRCRRKWVKEARGMAFLARDETHRNRKPVRQEVGQCMGLCNGKVLNMEHGEGAKIQKGIDASLHYANNLELTIYREW